MTPDERRLSRDEPPDTPGDHLDRMTPDERARVLARTRSSSEPRWRPAIRPTSAEVSRARALLAPGYWHEGTIEEAGNTQYRGAWHPSRGGGRPKGVEVWHRATG